MPGPIDPVPGLALDDEPLDVDHQVVHAHDGSVVVLPFTGSNVILLRQFRAAVDGIIIEAPAGKRDVPGEDPADTARRECIEEAGFEPGRLTLIHRFGHERIATALPPLLEAVRALGRRVVLGPGRRRRQERDRQQGGGELDEICRTARESRR